MPKVYAKAFTAAELTKFGAALRRGDVVRTVAKGDKQVVYTAAGNAVIPRLKYFVRGYREVDLGKNDALQSAFADVLRQRRNDASTTKDSRDSDTSIRSTDSSSSGGAKIDGSDAPSETDQGPAYERLAPNFFTQPKVSARTLKAYVSAGVLNLSLRELSSELSDKKSALHTHLVKNDYPFIEAFSAFVQKYEAGNNEDREAMRWQAHAGELPELTVFLGVWARHSGKSASTLASVEGGSAFMRIAALLQPTPRIADLPFSCCRPQALEDMAEDMSAKSDGGTLSKEWAADLGKRMAAELDHDPDSERAKTRRTCFAMSDGADFRSELLHLLRPYLIEQQLISMETPSPFWLEEAVKSAYDIAVASLSSGMLTGTGVLLPGDGIKRDLTLTVDGVKYVHTKNLGNGGNGAVQLFTGPQGETIAVKSPLRLPDAFTRLNITNISEHADIFTAQTDEARVHSAAVVTADRPRPLRTPDGVLRLMLPYYPNGDATKLRKTIAACVENGTLSQKTAMLVRRAVLADMTREVLKLKKAGLLHNDVKCPNFCIDASGRLHLIDFGTASMGPSRLTSENSKAENPRFIACEIETNVRQQVEIKSQKTNARRRKLRDDRLKVPDGEGREKRLGALQKKCDADIREIKAAPAEYAKYDQSAEMWSLGVAAFELFGLQSQYSLPKPGPDSTAPDGDSTADDYYFPFDGTSHGQVASRLATFKTETPDQRKQILNLSRCGRKSPLGRRDDAIFAMLDPDPTTRITPEALLKSRFLADDDLDNPALRTLIAALGSGDRQAIRKATSRVE